MMKKFYKIISIVFQPLLMPTYALLMLVNMDIFTIFPAVWKWIAVVGTLLFTGILPAIPILLMMRKGDIHDIFISKREQRTIPYLFSFLAYVFWAMFMWRTLHLPTFIVAMAIGSALSIFAVMFINLKWKISAHMAGIGGLTASIFGICYRMGLNPLLIFSIALFVSALVAISRMELKAHTPAQVLAGYALGFVLVLVPAFIF